MCSRNELVRQRELCIKKTTGDGDDSCKDCRSQRFECQSKEKCALWGAIQAFGTGSLMGLGSFFTLMSATLFIKLISFAMTGNANHDVGNAVVDVFFWDCCSCCAAGQF